MNQKKDEDLDRLLGVARGFSPDIGTVDHHFEMRLMARIRQRRSEKSLWSWTWRLIPAFTVLAAILSVASVVMEANRPCDIVSAVVVGNENQMIHNDLVGG